MPFSVALNQPRFASDDDGGMGDWSDVVGGIVDIAQSAAKVGVSYLQSQQPTPAQAQAQVAAMQQYYAAQPSSFTSSPMFLPLVGGLGLLLFMTMRKGRR